MRETVKVSKIFLLIEKFQKLDRSLINMVLVLGLISILCLYSIDKGQGTIYLKHLVRFIFAFLILIIVAFTHVNFWYRYAYHFYFLILFLLIVLKFVGVTAKGAQRWLDFGFFHVQPSEVAKLAIILVLAKFYNLVKVENKKLVWNDVIRCNSRERHFLTNILKTFKIFYPSHSTPRICKSSSESISKERSCGMTKPNVFSVTNVLCSCSQSRCATYTAPFRM